MVARERLERAKVVLGSGRSVIVDASSRMREMRERARRLARSLGIGFAFEWRAPVEVCRQRILERAAGPSISDGRAEILDAFVERCEPVSELCTDEHLVADSAAPLAESLDQLARRGLLPQ